MQTIIEFYSNFLETAILEHITLLRGRSEIDFDETSHLIAAHIYLEFRVTQHVFFQISEDELSPREMNIITYANNFFRAIVNDNLPTVRDVLEQNQERALVLIEHDNYICFKLAAHKANLGIMQHLYDSYPVEQKDKLISVNNFEIFSCAVLLGKTEVVRLLLTLATADQKLQMIRLNDYQAFRFSAFIGNNDVINLIVEHIDGEDIRSMIAARNYESIKSAFNRNQPEILALIMNLVEDDLDFTDTVISIIEEQVSGEEEPLVTSCNPESAMRNLSSSENFILKDVISHYEHLIPEAGPEAIINDLRTMLAKKYEENPEQLDDNLTLPLSWHDFTQLPEDVREQAMPYYYKNPYHTAYRYLLKPNPWLSEQALYAHFEESGGYSSFEDFIFITALFYLAAIDENMPPIDNHTLESRIDGFICDLALINRAHNWDKTRINSITGLEEEYDDLEGDKPSCNSGVMLRLLQSVRGHGLFKFVTLNVIKSELISFVRQHFIANITEQNFQTILEAIRATVDSATASAALSVLNISPDKQQAFIQSMATKYQEKFTNNHSLPHYISKRFATPLGSHAMEFYQETGLENILLQKLQHKNIKRSGIFATEPDDSDSKPEKIARN